MFDAYFWHPAITQAAKPRLVALLRGGCPAVRPQGRGEIGMATRVRPGSAVRSDQAIGRWFMAMDSVNLPVIMDTVCQ